MTDVFFIEREQHGARLQHVVAARYPDVSVGSLRRLMIQGGVRVNGIAGTRNMKVSEGDRVEAALPDEEVRPAKTRRREALDILYEDAACLAINKPAGLAVVPERNAEDYPLMDALLDHARRQAPAAAGQPVRPMIVHRLDRDTTGVLLIAKGPDAMRDLTEQFAGRSVRKEYLAIVRGRPPQEAEIALRLTSRRARRGRTIVNERHGREALTLVTVEEYFRGFALVRAVPKTGRTHQVRAHLRAAGCPAVADPLYGESREPSPLYLSEMKRGYRPKKGQPEPPVIARQALHAARLEFDTPLPGGRRRVSVEAPLPKDMERTLKMLRKYRPEPV